MRVMERGVLLLAVALGVALLSMPVRAAPYAAIVMDMRDGRVLYAENADHPQHPASLTKMMTLYLTFEAVESGQLSLDQNVRVSRKAARQPASKLYLKAGSRVSIRSLIRAAAIKSANDAAMVLAEAVGGSEAAFGRLMTAKARALGMRNTTFKNPHGLTESGHLSTVRDMAILARHLFFDFPDYYNIFGKRSDIAAGKRIWTTNRLLGSYRGAEGMKTGYTRAAGYNLVATASRGTERVVAVVMGGKSSRWRNRKVAELLDLGFRKTPTQVAVVPPKAGATAILVARAPLPEPKPGGSATGLAAIAEQLSSPAIAAVAPTGSRSAPLYAAFPVWKPRPSSGVQVASAGSVFPLPEARPDWSVAIGQFDDEAAAVAAVNAVALSNLGPLKGAAPKIEQVDGKSGAKLYNVAFTGLDNGAANNACIELLARGRDCVTVAPYQ